MPIDEIKKRWFPPFNTTPKWPMGHSPKDDVSWLMKEVIRLREVLMEIAQDDSTNVLIQAKARAAAETETADEWP